MGGGRPGPWQQHTVEGEALGDGHFAVIVGTSYDATVIVRTPLSIHLRQCEGQ